MEEGQEVVQETPEPEQPEQVQTDEITPGKTYSDKEVSDIVQKRLKNWSDFGKPEEVKSKFDRLSQLERFVGGLRDQFGQNGQLPGQKAAAVEETPQDKQVRAYMEKMYPELGKLNQYFQSINQNMQSLDAFRWQTVTQQNSGMLKNWAEKAGYKPEHVAELEDKVAASIQHNRKDYAEYMKTGSHEIVKAHFEAVDKWIKSFSTQTTPNVGAAQAAAKVNNLPKRLPPGGVAAVTSNKKKLNDSERVDAAYAAFTKT